MPITKTEILGFVTVVDTTYSALSSAKTISTLLRGTTYKITDRFNYQVNGSGSVPNLTFSGDDRGFVYVRALENNTLSREAIRVVSCPKFYDSSIHGSDSWKGIWDLNLAIAINDLVIWGGKVWKNLSGNIGTANSDLTLDGVDWEYQNMGDYGG